jgi:hypothetical protein
VVVDVGIPKQQSHLVNWDELQIEERQDDEGEGRIEIFDEDQVYHLLGLRTDDNPEQSATDATSNADDATTNNGGTVPDVGARGAAMPDVDTGGAAIPEVDTGGAAIPDIDTRGAAIPVDDAIPEERVLVYDPNKPCMDIGTVFPSMVDFRLAVRQFAINKQFGLHTAKTDRERFIGKCLGAEWY